MKKLYTTVVAVLIGFVANAQIVTIPDANFMTKLLAASPLNSTAQNIAGANIKIDTNNDGNIQESEALNVLKLNVSTASITNVTGIGSFTNLVELGVYNNQISSLDLTGLNSLTTLNASYNSLSSINTIGAPNIQYLNIWNNQITTIDVTNWPNLKNLTCFNNLITSLSISNTSSFERLSCELNNLTYLSLQNLPNLTYINANNNQLPQVLLFGLNGLTNIDFSHNQLTDINLNDFQNLYAVNISYNQFTTVDASSLFNLNSLNCNGNAFLEYIFSKNGRNETLYFASSPLLKYMCLDDFQLANVQSNVNFYGLTNCFINSYCSFNPGGVYYTVEGNNKLDNNNNGCDSNDLIVPNLKFNITSTNGSSGTLISNAIGAYRIPVSAGNYSLSPVLEYPSYFTVSPGTVNADFPVQSSPLIGNFCISPNGFHPDLEVILLPFLGARPGSDAYYTIVIRNNGNINQSGTLNLNFNDSVLDFVYATPSFLNVSANNLSWNFTNLEALQSIIFGVIFNVNSPMETPAVNSGYVLHYVATATSLNTDDTPQNNSSVLNQTVANSFDPNDKTCIEGTTITPSMVGDYVHYIIRFENTGTANAQNVVVKDMIDTTKFDLTTLVPLNGSHSFITRINGNRVEFIFENINLPFDDANNDGHLAFKIKTKPSLLVGDTFSNSANIYFDYNFPITTNTYTTSIATLNTQDFEFNNFFTLSPIPTKNLLTITKKEETTISSVNIYNTLGQLLQVNTNPAQTIDVSELQIGSYIIKIVSEKGSATAKFIKE